MDKTGTVTNGKPVLTDIVTTTGIAAYGKESAENRLLALTAAAEKLSEHPLAEAIVAGAADRGLILPTAEQFDNVPGRGIMAVVSDQQVRWVHGV